jgi:hypothetical protein
MFSSFIAHHGPPQNRVPVPPEVLSAYRDRLPPQLIDFWEENGWCSFANGFFGVWDPQYLSDPLEDWLESSPAFWTIVRTGLAHVFVWSDNCVFLLNPLNGRLNKLTDDIEIFFNTVLCDPDVLKGLDKDIFDTALPRLGPPDHTECFGFVPALSLGGPRDSANLQMVQIREYLAILAQISPP